eukprot:SAG31_NODE_25088_length_468_cov_0.802168_1_plen_24_part_10
MKDCVATAAGDGPKRYTSAGYGII